MKETILKIEGMHCASCALTIEKALKGRSGVTKASVNYATEKAYVQFDPARVELEALADAVRETGYGVRTDEPDYSNLAGRPGLQKITFRVDGMHCASCALNVERALSSLEGVRSAVVNLASEKATAEIDPGIVTFAQVAEAVGKAGYKVPGGLSAVSAEGHPSGDAAADEELGKVRAVRLRMWTAWGLAAPIVILMVLDMFFGIMWPGHTGHRLLSILFALPVLLWSGGPTLRSAGVAVRHGRANMDVLIAMGTVVSFLTGPLGFFIPIANYAGISAMIMAFHLTGRAVETAAKGRASQAIRKLLSLGAKTARVLVDGGETEVPVNTLKTGDVMAVRPGEKIPTDGVVVEGEGWVDESMATGESMPVHRGPSDELIGATVNLEGFLKVRVTKVGKDTFLSQVVKLVQECQGSKVPIQAFADRITAFFVPVILALAALTFLLWLLIPGVMLPIAQMASAFLPWVDPSHGGITLALFAAVAVLVIACPCALGLATPTALMVGSGIGAENGVLIRNGEAIQALKDVDVIVLDKTGTITKGRPEVTDILPRGGAPRHSPGEASRGGGAPDRAPSGEDELLALAASVESGSEHPLGQAVVRLARERGLTLTQVRDFKAVRGRGVRGVVGSRKVFIGSPAFMGENGIDVAGVGENLSRLEGEAKTVMVVGADGEAAGTLALADTLKEDSVSAIGELREMGIEVVMITGDNRATAEAVARKVRVSRVIAEVLPEGKVSEIRRLQAEGRKVAMVGDGINDAPALSQANVGIAIGTGTDIAIEASDVTLVRGDLGGVVTAVKLSIATFRKIRQNLFWAFFYNLVAIPAAVFGLLHPVIAEAAMATSSVNVVTNANLLRWAKIKPANEAKRARPGGRHKRGV